MTAWVAAEGGSGPASLEGRSAGDAAHARAAAWRSLRVVGVLAILAWLCATPLTRHFAIHADLPVALLMAVILAMAALGRLPAISIDAPLARLASRRAATVLALLVAGLSWAVGRWVLLDAPLSRDEQMALFDAANFSSGQWATPVPEAWRSLGTALNTMFMYAVPENAAMLSSYLPGNAFLQAAGLRLGLADWVNPGLALLAVLATGDVAWRVTRDRAATGLAMLLVASAPQVWTLSGTAYAMPAHLALNTAWLALVLRERAWAHVAAVPVAWLATGLHQIVFHPLFAGPFVLWLLWQRRWLAAAWHTLAFAAIGLFWLAWPDWVVSQVSPTGAPPASGARDGVFALALQLLGDLSPESLKLMGANVLRWFAWQNLALLPLLVLGIGAALRTRHPLLLALGATLLLTPLVVGVLLAYQGHGWGYRYMHGLIGVAAVLAASGWRALAPRAAGGLAVAATLATLCIAAPWQLWNAHRFVEPFAKAHALVRASDADVVLVDAKAAPFAVDLVLNTPRLSRPIVLVEQYVSSDALRRICAASTVTRPDAGALRDIRAVFGADAVRPQAATAAAAAPPCSSLEKQP